MEMLTETRGRARVIHAAVAADKERSAVRDERREQEEEARHDTEETRRGAGNRWRNNEIQTDQHVEIQLRRGAG